MHQRSDKNSHLDTILYEIDMQRHCAATVGQKQADEHKSEFARSEYYLTIEGFLQHLRNLLAFFTNRKDEDSDLIINEPEVWAGQPVEQFDYSALIKAFKEFNRRHGVTVNGQPNDCYTEISKFLNHCTTHRYERAKPWPVDQMNADLKPVLAEFESRFANNVKRTDRKQEILGVRDNSTATFRTLPALFDVDK